MVHTLSLLDASPGLFVCNICREPGCGPVYHCSNCEFNVHVTCAATAKQQTHITHPHHPLHLVQCSTLRHECDSCGMHIDTLSFRCDMCDFDIHPTCVRAPRFIKHPSHPHPLTLSKSSSPSDSLRRCDGCKMQVGNFFYHCDRPVPGLGSCNYVLHQICATLPAKVKHSKHQQHILTLLDQPSQLEMAFSCAECGTQLKGWRFHCAGCNFNLHPGCATSVHEFVQPHPDPEVILQDRNEASSSSTKSVMRNVGHAPVLHAISALVPSDNDLEAIEKFLRFARELVKGHSLADATQESAQLRRNEEEEVCPTCLEGYDLGNPKKLTSCGHHFHLACILNWMERSPFCAICRKVISIRM